MIAEGQDWSPAERWAWSEIKQGNVADFNNRSGCGAHSLDPKKKEDGGTIAACSLPAFWRPC
jgi:hypothetical protein